VPSAAHAGPQHAASPSTPTTSSATAGDTLEYFDSRSAGAATQKALNARAATLAAKPSQGVRDLRHQLGTEGILDMDPLTATPRSVGRTDGFLSGPSKAAASSVALGYVGKHPDVFGLTSAEESKLSLRRDYVDIAGTHHLSWIQQVGGVPVFGNGLQANVAADGRLISVLGSPVKNLSAPGGSASVTASGARDKAIRDVKATPSAAKATSKRDARQTTDFANGDEASLVVFDTLAGPRTAWQTITTPTHDSMYEHVIDASTGRVLYRRSLVQNDKASVVDFYPGAPQGGNFHTVNLNTNDWLPNNSPRLAGNVAHVYSDVNDNNAADPAEEVSPSGPKSFVYPQTVFDLGGKCSTAFRCTWDPTSPNSWQVNRAQAAVQQFYFLGKYHDHLAAAPIGFTRTAGNFEAVDGDAVQGEALDGADTANGLPDGNHIDNANFGTPPDGTAPRMQMYLWHFPGNPNDRFNPTSGTDDGDIVFHEYTHGLSNRLVIDALGNSTLGNIQAGAMGEAWSDWYALDFLNDQGYVADTKADGEVILGGYVGAGTGIRSEPTDCPVGSTSAKCPGKANQTKAGGYTYGDFGHIRTGNTPEVHADGEIWAQTLWDLRNTLGSKKTESLVTRAMELSPANPSFLDERNAILQADMVVNGGKAHDKIWKVFAHRGMGFFAAALDGDDTHPAEDFSLPPAPGTPTGSVTGTVTDRDTGTAVSGVTVAFGGHASGFAGDYAAVTDAAGKYTISGVFPGTYAKVFARGAGYDMVQQTLSVASRTNTVNWQLRRDWAALSGGGSVISFTGPDYTGFGCGPDRAVDQSQGQGWGSDSVDAAGNHVPQNVVVKFPRAVNIAEVGIDPANTCGDDPTASTAGYRVETSPDGTTWTVAASGTFTGADRGRLNSVPLTAGTTGVQYLRFTELGPQVDWAGCPNSGDSGCLFMDMSELEVYGAPA
jgi:Zn-dependent metalloprotease